jgi:hypothetical protein
MVSTTSHYIVRFAVHTSLRYRDNYLAELAENTGADTRELSDGRIEIAGFRTNQSNWILDALKKEERRGGLIIEEFC